MIPISHTHTHLTRTDKEKGPWVDQTLHPPTHTHKSCGYVTTWFLRWPEPLLCYCMFQKVWLHHWRPIQEDKNPHDQSLNRTAITVYCGLAFISTNSKLLFQQGHHCEEGLGSLFICPVLPSVFFPLPYFSFSVTQPEGETWRRHLGQAWPSQVLRSQTASSGQYRVPCGYCKANMELAVTMYHPPLGRKEIKTEGGWGVKTTTQLNEQTGLVQNQKATPVFFG